VSFGSPYLLLTLVAVPLAAVVYALLEARRAERAAAWSRPALLPNMVSLPSRRLGYLPAGLLLCGVTLLLVGFARPQRVLGSVSGGSATVVVAVDVSGSMAAHDVAPTRIAAARTVAARFVGELPPRFRVALVTFGDKVRAVVPPTLDHRQVIDALPTSITPRAGTSIGDAIGASVAVAIEAVGTSDPANLHPPAAVLLLSDGTQTSGGTLPKDAAQIAYVDGIPIDTVALGTPEGTVTQPVTVNGFRAPLARPVPVDRALLQSIAQQTGGTAFRAGSRAELAAIPGKMATVYQKLRSRDAPGHRTQELSALAGGLALALIAAGIVLSSLWYGRPA
jgi:Ca-activated chloride channel homolog